MKQGIIFDMDGTLWDSAENVAASWTKVVQKEYRADRVITEQEIQSVMGKTMDQIAAILFGELSQEKQEELLAHCCKEENEYLRAHGGVLYPKLEETLQQLQKDYRLYIVSNCFGNNGLDKGTNIRRLMDRNHLQQAVYVGDIQGDYEASSKAGVQFIHAAYGFGTIKEKVPKIHAISELPEIVKNVW